MSDFTVTGALILDMSDGYQKIAAFRAVLDEVTKAAAEARRKIMSEISQVTASISTMMTAYSQIMHLLGMQADAFYAALIGMTLSTVSMLISIASALATTVVGIPALYSGWHRYISRYPVLFIPMASFEEQTRTGASQQKKRGGASSN